MSWTMSGQTYTISTFAGGVLPVNIPGTSAFLKPAGVAVDKSGNVFFASGNTVMRWDAATSILTLVAGNGTVGSSGDNGPALNAQLYYPISIAVDGADNIYVLEQQNSRIRKIANGVITTVAGTGMPYDEPDGPALSTGIGGAVSVAVDSSGVVYFSEGARVRKVSNGLITTVAGNRTSGFSGDNGPATSAQLDNATGLAIGPTGQFYIVDTGNLRIRMVSNGVITTVAGTGTAGSSGDGGLAISAQLNYPNDVAVDSAGNLYIAIARDGAVRKVSPTGVISTVVSGISGPQNLALDSAGNFYALAGGAYSEGTIQKIVNGTASTIIGGGPILGADGPAAGAQLFNPLGVALDSSGSLYIADTALRKLSGGIISTFGSTPFGCSGEGSGGIAADQAGNVYIPANHTVVKFSAGAFTIVAGNGTSGFSGDNGPATQAELKVACGVAVDSAGNLYISDAGNNRVRKVSNGIITTVAGNGTAGFSGDNGPATAAALFGPSGLAVDAAGRLYIVDTGNLRIRVVSGGVISTFAGNGGYEGPDGPATGTGIGYIYNVAADASGTVYFSGPDSVRRVAIGAITTIAGGGDSFGDNGPATSAQISGAEGIAVDAFGRVYFAELGNQRIRLLTPPAPVISSLAPSSVNATGVAFRLTVNGTGFLSGATVQWNGTALPTTFVSVTQLTASVAASLIASAGEDNVGVVNPGGVDSAEAVFTVNAPAGSAPQTITFGPLSDVIFGAPPLAIVATASSGLTVSFASTTLAVCTVAGTTVTLVAPGTCSITAAQTGNATFAAATPVTQTFAVGAASGSGPVIAPGGIGPLSTLSPAIQPGSWVNIYGSNLATTTATWNNDFPTSLGGVTVTINGKKAYLLYVSPTQIDLQSPDDTTTGNVTVTVTNSSGSWTSIEMLVPVSPSFSVLDAKHVAGIILRFNGSGTYGSGTYDYLGPTGTSLGFKTVAATAGDVVELYGVGFGPTIPPVSAGQAISGGEATANTLQLVIGGTTVTPSFAGLSSFAGLYQINLTIPAGLGTGDQSLIGLIGGVQTQSGIVISLQ